MPKKSKGSKKREDTSGESNEQTASLDCSSKNKCHNVMGTGNYKRSVKIGESSLNCKICDYNTRDSLKMDIHIYTHVDSSFNKCQKCAFKCRSKVKLKRHLELHLNQNNLQETCPICLEILPTFQSYTTHKRKHIIFRPTKVYKYKCSECKYSAKLMAPLWKHLILHYRKKYKCPFSDYCSDRKSAIERHFRYIHSGKLKKYQKKTKKNDMPKSTRPSVAVDSSPMSESGNMKGFQSINSLHMEDMKTSVSFKSNSFPLRIKKENINPTSDTKLILSIDSSKRKYGILNDLYNKYNNKVPSNVDEKFIHITQENFEKGILLEWDRLFKKGTTIEKKYKCNQCNYKSNKKSHLSYHMYVHSNEEYYCPVCDFVSHSKISLEKHVKNHGLNKSFKCRKCDYKTNSSYDFKNHERKHLGIRILKCANCTFATNYKADLARHQSIHQPKEGQYSCKQCKFAAAYKNELALHELEQHIKKKGQ